MSSFLEGLQPWPLQAGPDHLCSAFLPLACISTLTQRLYNLSKQEAWGHFPNHQENWSKDVQNLHKTLYLTGLSQFSSFPPDITVASLVCWHLQCIVLKWLTPCFLYGHHFCLSCKPDSNLCSWEVCQIHRGVKTTDTDKEFLLCPGYLGWFLGEGLWRTPVQNIIRLRSLFHTDTSAKLLRTKLPRISDSSTTVHRITVVLLIIPMFSW